MDQAITSSHPVCSTLEPTACLAGNSDPAHLLSDPEKSNPTEAKICTFVMVTSSIHLILSNSTPLAKLKQMDATFLEGNPPKNNLNPFTSIQCWLCSAGHILPVGSFPSCPKHTSSLCEHSTALLTLLLSPPATARAPSPPHSSAIPRNFTHKELNQTPLEGDTPAVNQQDTASSKLFCILGNPGCFMKEECALLVQLVARALLCTEKMKYEHAHFYFARLVLCALKQVSSALWI